MKNEGPSLDHLLQRLSAPPPSGHQEWALVNIPAAAISFLLKINPAADTSTIGPHWTKYPEKTKIIGLALWLYQDPVFANIAFPDMSDFFTNGLKDFSKLVTANMLFRGEKSEEFVRRCLNALSLRPAGETQQQAEARFNEIDSVAADRRADQNGGISVLRAKEIIEEMQDKAAQAASSKVGRE